MTLHAEPSTELTRPSSARRPLQALAAAVIVAAVLLLGLLVGFGDWILHAGSLSTALAGLGNFGTEVLVNVVPFALGVFLILWLWPMRPGDRLPFTLLKALVAAAAGAGLTLATPVVFAFVRSTEDGLYALQTVVPSSASAFLVSVIGHAPLVMLVVLVQWVIARRELA